MAIKNLLKRAAFVVACIVATVICVGCFDLGGFQNDEDYYAALGDVRLVYQNPESTDKDIKTKDYSVEDYFYNKNTGENFSYGNPDDNQSDEGKNIPQLPYLYMAIPVQKDVEIDSFALYFNGVETGSLKIAFYVVDELPNAGSFSDIKCHGDAEFVQKLDGEDNPMFDIDGNPIYQEKLDGEGNPMYDEAGNLLYERIQYTDPEAADLVGTATVHLQKEEWNSVLVDTWDGIGAISVKKSQYILLRFMNNGAYNTGEPIMAFKTTNLLLRSIG